MIINRIAYVFLLAVCIALFLFYHNFFFLYLLIAVGLLPIVSFFVSRGIARKTKAYLSVPFETIGEDNDIPVEFKIENGSFLPMPEVKLEYKAQNGFYPNNEIQELKLPLRSGESKYEWIIKSVYAGRIIIEGRKMIIRDYLGLFVFKKAWNAEASISVIPPQSDIIMNVIGSVMTLGDDAETDSGESIEDVTQVREFREYRPGDRMQRVNWKISAKHDELYVKEFEQVFNQQLSLLIELRRDDEEIGFLDELLTAFWSAATKLIDMDIRFSVRWYDCEQGAFRSENVEEEEGLLDAVNQMYMMKSYEGYPAFEHFKEMADGRDAAVYFTSPSFAGYDEAQKLGTFKERVTIICL